MFIQSSEVETLGITVVSGDQWRDEEVAHTLRLLEIIGRTDISVVPGRWERLYGKVVYQGAWNEAKVDPGQGVAHHDRYYGPLGRTGCCGLVRSNPRYEGRTAVHGLQHQPRTGLWRHAGVGGRQPARTWRATGSHPHRSGSGKVLLDVHRPDDAPDSRSATPQAIR